MPAWIVGKASISADCSAASSLALLCAGLVVAAGPPAVAAVSLIVRRGFALLQ